MATLNGKDIAVITIHHLALYGSRKGAAPYRQRIAIDEKARIAPRMEMTPFEFEDEVFVMLHRAQDARRQPRADDHLIAHSPGAGSPVDVDPAGEITSVKERLEAGFFRAALQGEAGHKKEDIPQGALHRHDPSRSTCQARWIMVI